MKTRNLLLTLLLVIISVIQLYGSYINSRPVEYAVKPLILAWITLYFLLNTRPARGRNLVILAFLFSWIGDFILMFAWKNDLFFFAGVGGFFLSQVTYIAAFSRYALSDGRGFLSRKPVWILPFIAYLVGMAVLLLPHLEGIMIPVVLLYAVSLVAMSALALNRFGLSLATDARMVFAGSVLFVMSDTLLAVNKFMTSLPHGGFWVMLTYILAQYLIMMGLKGRGIKA